MKNSGYQTRSLNEPKNLVVVIGASFGGYKALETILTPLPGNIAFPIVIVQHISPESDRYMIEDLGRKSAVTVKEAEEKEKLQPGTVYFAPANYHLLIEEDWSLSLSIDEKVNFSRPSIDVLFESAACSLGPATVGIILTGANEDGSLGLQKIKECGGIAVIQDPSTAVAPAMPRAALERVDADHVLPLHEIGPFLKNISQLHKIQKSPLTRSDYQ